MSHFAANRPPNSPFWSSSSSLMLIGGTDVAFLAAAGGGGTGFFVVSSAPVDLLSSKRDFILDILIYSVQIQGLVTKRYKVKIATVIFHSYAQTRYHSLGAEQA